MYCPQCGTQNDDNAFKCIQCGTVIQQVPVQIKQKNTALVVLVIAGIALVLIAIIGILAAIAIPALLGARAKAQDRMVYAEIQNACNTALTTFAENPEKTEITLSDLEQKGFILSPDIELQITDGTQENLTLYARHNKGNTAYMADKNCNVQKVQPY